MSDDAKLVTLARHIARARMTCSVEVDKEEIILVIALNQSIWERQILLWIWTEDRALAP